jgi:hypothetical protein
MAGMKSDLPHLVTVKPDRRFNEKVPIYNVVMVEPGRFRAYVEGPFVDDWIDLRPGTVREAFDNIGLHLEHHIKTLADLGFSVVSPPI